MHHIEVSSRRRIGRLIVAVLLAAASLVLVGWICAAALLIENQHADNLYNLGLVRRSIENTPPPLLETSYVHWFFEQYPQIRTEDWHRSASLLGIVAFGKLVGTDNELALRLLHLGWMTLWMVVLAWLTVATIRQFLPESRGRLPALWGAAVCVMLVALGITPGVQVATAAFMDDVPAAVCVLTGFALLLARHPPRKRLAAAGVAFGLAFCMKDMALLWGPVGLLAALIVGAMAGHRRRVLLVSILVFSVGWLASTSLKIGWNLAELGRPLPQEANLGMQGRTLRNVPVGEHFIFYLHDDLSVREGNLLRTDFQGLVDRVSFASRLTAGASGRLGWMWVWLGLALVGCVVHETTPRVVSRLLLFLGVSIAALAGMFVLHLAEPHQLRYWLVPSSLTAVVGIAGGVALLTFVGRGPQRVLRIAVVSAVCGALLLVPLFSAKRQLASLRGRLPYHPAAEHAALAAAGTGSVLLQTTRGMQLWSRHPQARVVAVSFPAMAALDSQKLQSLVDDYDIRSAILSRQTPDGRRTVRELATVGFSVVRMWDQDALLIRPTPRYP